MCRQVSVTLLCKHKGFPHLNEEADNHDIIIILLTSMKGEHKREVHMNPEDLDSGSGSGWFVW